MIRCAVHQHVDICRHPMQLSSTALTIPEALHLTSSVFICSVLQVHRKIREDSDMAQDSLQCLAQLASMHGPVFPDESAQVTYLAHLVEGLLSMINGSVCWKHLHAIVSEPVSVAPLTAFVAVCIYDERLSPGRSCCEWVHARQNVLPYVLCAYIFITSLLSPGNTSVSLEPWLWLPMWSSELSSSTIIGYICSCNQTTFTSAVPYLINKCGSCESVGVTQAAAVWLSPLSYLKTLCGHRPHA